jgi:mannose-1-phosphate guanylyltransferase
VLDRPVMAHTVDLLDRHGITEAIANLHHFPDPIREYFGDRLAYRYEEELLGTAGGVRNCADFFGDEPFIVVSGDALTDMDLKAFYDQHVENGAVATIAVKRVADTREYGVVIHDDSGRITGFQEKPAPADALSDLGNCGIYAFSPAVFEYFPEAPFADWAHDVFPKLLEDDAAFFIHDLGDQYWNDVGSLLELKQATFDALTGALHLEVPGEEVAPGLVVGDGTALASGALAEPPVWIGSDVHVGADVRLQGPVVIGDNASIGDGAALKDCVVLPGTEIAPDTIAIGAILGNTDIAGSLRPRNS